MSGSTISTTEYAALREAVESCQDPDLSAPLPWDVLELLGRLIPCDVHNVMGLDPPARHVYLEQQIVGGETILVSRGPAERAEPSDPDDPFWTHYGSSLPCCAPDMPGAAPVSTCSDFYSDRQWWSSPMRSEYLVDMQREMMLAFDDGGSRTFRLLFFRGPAPDFTDKERFFLRLLMPHIEQRYRRWQRVGHDDLPLTPRQRELLTEVARGLTNRQVGRALGLTEATVRTHLENIYERLEVSSRTEAVVVMQQGSWAEPSIR